MVYTTILVDGTITCVYYLVSSHEPLFPNSVSSSSDSSTPKRPKISPVVRVSFMTMLNGYYVITIYCACVARGEKYISCSA